MQSEESLDAPTLMDLFSPGAADDPHPAYHELQEKCPVQRAPGMFGDFSVNLSRYEDVMWAMRHPEVFSSKDVVKVGNEMPLIPLSVDPPDHLKYRRLLDPEFSPKKMGALETESRALVNTIIDEFVDRGECEFHEDFATPLPSTIFLALIGLPQSDLPQFLRWRDDTIRPDATNDVDAQTIRDAAGQAISGYFEGALEDKRVNPDDRLLTRIVNAKVDGRPLTHDEMLGICHLLLLGGLDTVTATLDCMIAYLAKHPERRRAIVADPTLMNPAIEELLRHQTPVMIIPRVVAQDVEIAGVKIAAGDGATLLLGAANVDPAEFDDPDDVRLDRGANRHLAFGGGPHRCLGSHLARMELRVAMEEFHKRIPEYELAEGAEVHFSGGIRQAENLPLVFPTARVKAAVLRAPGAQFEMTDLTLRALGPRDVHVRIAASGVCRSDLSIQDGTIPHPLPAVLGHEGAGIVTEVGAQVTTVAPGDHVVLSWVAPCRRCFYCLRDHPELCEHGLDHAFAQPYATDANGVGLLAAFGTATFGEETVLPETACVRIDNDFPLELAALVGCGVVTGVGAVCNSARVEPGASVAVIGCGGVGLAAIQGARLAGAAPIIAVDTVPSKLDLARANGATEVVDASRTDAVQAVRELTGGRGADYAIEVVGRSATIRQAFDMTRRAGTVTIVGAGSFTDMVEFGAMQLMVDAKTIRGCVYGATDPLRDFPEMVRLHRAGRLDLNALVTRRIALEDLEDAFRAMQAGEVARSVIVY